VKRKYRKRPVARHGPTFASDTASRVVATIAAFFVLKLMTSQKVMTANGQLPEIDDHDMHMAHPHVFFGDSH